MKTMQELEAEQRKEREELAALLALKEQVEAMCPIAPHGVSHHVKSLPPTATYKVQTVQEAAAIVEAWGERQGVHCVCDGCTMVYPPHLLTKGYQGKVPRWVCESALELRQNGNAKYYWGAELSFFPVALPNLCVDIEIKEFPHKHRVRSTVEYGKGGEPVPGTARFFGGDSLHAHADYRLSYGGGSPDCFDRRYFYSNLEQLMGVFNND